MQYQSSRDFGGYVVTNIKSAKQHHSSSYMSFKLATSLKENISTDSKYVCEAYMLSGRIELSNINENKMSHGNELLIY